VTPRSTTSAPRSSNEPRHAEQMPLHLSGASPIDGLDGSEVRREWAPRLKTVVIKRMVQEVTDVMRRREQIFEDRYDLRG
ncbi:hypothetical protein ACQKJZ_13500, partial [Sphingomonas sp. NPDC019816]